MRPLSRKLHRLLPGLLAVALILTAARPLHAQEGGWSEPYALGPYWFPDVAADNTGRVHVVWSDSDAQYDMVMYATSPDGLAWSTPLDIAAYPPIEGTSEATRPTVLVGADSSLFLTSRLLSIYFARSNILAGGSAMAWSRPLPLAEGYFSRMVQDSSGRLYLFFTQNQADALCQLCYHMFSIRSDDNGDTWSSPVDISLVSNGTAKPQAIVDANDTVHLVFETGPGGSLGRINDPAAVVYTSSSDGGNTWNLPTQLGPAENAEGSARNIALIERPGQLLTVWWSMPDDRAIYRTSEDGGQTWGTARAVPGVYGFSPIVQSRLDTYTLATDSAGNTHLVMVGRITPDEESVRLLHLVWNGSAWSNPETIRRYEGDQPEWPRLTIGLGNQLHLVWFVRDKASIFLSEAGKYVVYYARATADSPALAPSLPPAPATTAATVVEEATALPVESPSPALEEAQRAPPQQEASLDTVQSENDEVLLLLLSLLPVAAIFAAIAVWRSRR